jgi:hypothetical protein
MRATADINDLVYVSGNANFWGGGNSDVRLNFGSAASRRPAGERANVTCRRKGVVGIFVGIFRLCA